MIATAAVVVAGSIREMILTGFRQGPARAMSSYGATGRLAEIAEEWTNIYTNGHEPAHCRSIRKGQTALCRVR